MTLKRGCVINIKGEDCTHVVLYLDERWDSLTTIQGISYNLRDVRYIIRQLDEKELYEERKSELLNKIPKEFHNFVSQYAWENGHSSGYDEVINIMSELICRLHPCIKEYEKSVLSTVTNSR